MTRALLPALLRNASVAAVLCAAVLWGARGHRDADRANARADSVTTELAAAKLRELGYQVTLANVAKSLPLPDTPAAVLTSYRARPTTVATVRVVASGSAVAPSSTVDDSASVWEARIVDGPLSLDAVVNHPARRLGVRWELLAEGTMVHSIMPDGRLMVAATSDDPRVVLEVPALYWSPPPVSEPGFPWGCVASAGATGAGTVASRDWRVALGGSLLTWRQCR